MMQPIELLARGLLLAGGCLAGLCGCGSSAPAGPNTPAPAAVVEMHIHSFQPDSVTIQAGQSVMWKNVTFVIPHTVTDDPKLAKNAEDALLPPGAAAFDSGMVYSGGSYVHVFGVAGTYRYFCKPHESNGMLGKVIVEAAATTR